MTTTNALIIEFAAMAMYATIAVFALIGAVLYWFAFCEMKRTKIIGAVAALMTALFIDAMWWGLSEFARFSSGEESYPTLFVNPVTLIIVKMLLAGTTIGFVLCSVREDKRAMLACQDTIKNKQVKQNG